MTEPTINEILTVCDLAHALVITEDMNTALEEPITDGEKDTIAKVIDWAQSLEVINDAGKVQLALDVLKGCGFNIGSKLLAPQVERILVLSTGHITKATADLLHEEAIPGVISNTKDAQLWWVYPYTDDPDGIPEELRTLMDHAKALECSWLCLDCDGPVVDYFPTWVW